MLFNITIISNTHSSNQVQFFLNFISNQFKLSLPDMDENRKKLAKKYERIKLTVSITESIISFILLLLFVWFGYSKKLELISYSKTTNPYFALLIYVGILGIVSAILSFPVDYFFGFRLEHKFGLSNLTFGKWIKESLKSVAVGIVLGLPILL